MRILLTAREEVRQARRSGQAVSGVGAENVAARDKADSKVTNFTSAAEGVLTVDNSDLNFGETLDVLVRIVDDAIEEQEYRQYVSNLEGYELDEGDEELIDGTAFSGGEARNGPKPVGVLAVVGRRTSANPPCLISWPTRNAPSSTILRAPREIRSMRSSPSMARIGCSSIPQVSNVVCTSCPARNTSPRCVRRPRSNVPSLPWCCSMPPSRFPTKT